MIAMDTSSLIAFLGGQKGKDVDAVDWALEKKLGVFPPPVLTELFSDPHMSLAVKDLLKSIPLLTVISGYWERAGVLRARIISHGLKAPLADTLIAQSCLDHRVPLVTRDADFRNFMRWGGLKLFVSPTAGV